MRLPNNLEVMTLLSFPLLKSDLLRPFKVVLRPTCAASMGLRTHSGVYRSTAPSTIQGFNLLGPGPIYLWVPNIWILQAHSIFLNHQGQNLAVKNRSKASSSFYHMMRLINYAVCDDYFQTTVSNCSGKEEQVPV